MQARGPLMVEHRVIERMISHLAKTLKDIEARRRVDPVHVDTVVDFIRTYADRTHHGKEEDILFREMKKRSLSEEDQRLMEELIGDHVLGRKTTRALVEANQRYRVGEESALEDIASHLRTLVDFYPKHIRKEDDVFFPHAHTYQSEQEDRMMLEEFWEFDRKMIHEKYRAVLAELES